MYTKDNLELTNKIMKDWSDVYGFVIIIGIVAVSAFVIWFLVQSGRKSNPDAPHALGLPQGSVRATLAITLILLFVLISLFFFLSVSETDKDKYIESILTIVGTLVIAVSSFYFGSKATEQGSKIAKDAFQEANKNNQSHSTEVTPQLILEAVAEKKDEWKNKYKCIDIKLGQKKVNEKQLEAYCIDFFVERKADPTDKNLIIPQLMKYEKNGFLYSIPTDVISVNVDSSHTIDPSNEDEVVPPPLG